MEWKCNHYDDMILPTNFSVEFGKFQFQISNVAFNVGVIFSITLQFDLKKSRFSTDVVT